MSENTADSIQLRVGEAVTLSLPGRGTAGYGWSFQMAGAERVLSVTRAAAAPAAGAGPPRTGSLDEVFTLQALCSGQVDLRFELRRSWETGQPAAQQRMIHVEVLAR